MLKTRRSAIRFALGSAMLGLNLPVLAWAQASPALAPRTSDTGGVRVVVKPKSVSAGSPWDFDVTMDTHTKPLDADLTKAAVLVDGGGRRYAATAWQGDPPGGHHRKGVLRFPMPATQSGTFKVQFENVGAPGQRVFEWTVK
jgi:hypothetical protein